MMKKATAKMGMKFEQGTADPNIWKVLSPTGELQGLIAVYVDDYLVTGPKGVCEDVHEWFSTTWQTTEIQYAAAENSIRFLGMEIRAIEPKDGQLEGYSLDQEGYVQELIRQYELDERQKSIIPATKEWMSLDPSTFPETFEEKDLKAAQSITGELALLAQRCRPDLAYTVSVMGSMMSKDPLRAVQIGMKTMAYLNLTRDWKLRYHAGHDPSLIVYTDSSYAPDGGRSHGGAVVFWAGAPVAWRSSRQTLITTSSAETELLEASEGTTLMASIDALLADVGCQGGQLRGYYVGFGGGRQLENSPFEGESRSAETKDPGRLDDNSLLSWSVTAGGWPDQDPCSKKNGDADEGVGTGGSHPSTRR